jgi:hypothetical protein
MERGVGVTRRWLDQSQRDGDQIEESCDLVGIGEWRKVGGGAKCCFLEWHDVSR